MALSNFPKKKHHYNNNNNTIYKFLFCSTKIYLLLSCKITRTEGDKVCVVCWRNHGDGTAAARKRKTQLRVLMLVRDALGLGVWKYPYAASNFNTRYHNKLLHNYPYSYDVSVQSYPTHRHHKRDRSAFGTRRRQIGFHRAGPRSVWADLYPESRRDCTGKSRTGMDGKLQFLPACLANWCELRLSIWLGRHKGGC